MPTQKHTRIQSLNFLTFSSHCHSLTQKKKSSHFLYYRSLTLFVAFTLSQKNGSPKLWRWWWYVSKPFLSFIFFFFFCVIYSLGLCLDLRISWYKFSDDLSFGDFLFPKKKKKPDIIKISFIFICQLK